MIPTNAKESVSEGWAVGLIFSKACALTGKGCPLWDKLSSEVVLSARRDVRLGRTLSCLRKLRAGSMLSVMDNFTVGNSILLHVSARLGSVVSVFDRTIFGPAVPALKIRL